MTKTPKMTPVMVRTLYSRYLGYGITHAPKVCEKLVAMGFLAHGTDFTGAVVPHAGYADVTEMGRTYAMGLSTEQIVAAFGYVPNAPTWVKK